MTALNKNNSAVKRIMQEARELANDPCTDYSAAPLEDDIFEWHCTLRGPAGTEFEGGVYHFRILLPAEYPFRPPSIMMLTPNGRFELNTKICISFTNYHEELWQPAWGVRTAIVGLQGFFPLKGQAAVGVGSIEYPATERKRLATLSRDWSCPHCQVTNLELLPDPVEKGESETKQQLGGHISESAEPTLGGPCVDTSAEHTHESNGSNLSSDVQPAAEVSLATPNRLNSSPGMPGHQGAIMHISPTLANASPPILFTSPGTDRSSPPSSLLPSRVSTAVAAVGPGAAQVTNPNATGPRRSSQKPPIFLDTAICILLVLLFAIICRRVV